MKAISSGGDEAAQGGPPAEMLEHERGVPFPVGCHHQDRRRGKVGQGAADGDIDEEQPERGIGRVAG